MEIKVWKHADVNRCLRKDDTIGRIYFTEMVWSQSKFQSKRKIQLGGPESLSMCKTGHRYLIIDQYNNMNLITLLFVSYKTGNITLYYKEYSTSLLGCVPSKMACSRPCGTLGCMYHSRRRRWRKTFSLDMPG